MVDGPVQLTTAFKDELADVRLLLSAAEGNVRAALLGDEPQQALDNALRMAAQAAATLKRLRKSL